MANLKLHRHRQPHQTFLTQMANLQCSHKPHSDDHEFVHCMSQPYRPRFKFSKLPNSIWLLKLESAIKTGCLIN
jgi:hypothetical protein